MKFGAGQSAPRKEDARFLAGRGRYVEDVALPRALAVFVRATVPQVRIAGIETAMAVHASGVQAVLTRRDHEADGIGGLACHTLFPGMH